MEPEPLKNKGVIGQYSDYEKFGDSINFKERMFFKSEIKSAVEWLKLILSGTVMTKEKNIYYWIDKAFEDVVEKH